ncbi:signal recognition particle protein [Metarhizium album ARSEF 1941]|uniref:Signal recognition particle subunit SRP72 n=1 Tax=Metarhizium album (strain ARSEF 1941) TaxID=1081103 RepID=A0A0B2X6J4_METAS|nr:signal recognition particle protein [Metarhizium album ARSEF 1941]KHO00911.1 signal recognition particle protein [Metarhizium album ARSEF 1941]
MRGSSTTLDLASQEDILRTCLKEDATRLHLCDVLLRFNPRINVSFPVSISPDSTLALGHAFAAVIIMPPQDPATTLGALLRAATIDDHDEVLKAANAALKANRTDELAQHTRVVALLKLDRFSDALRAISEGGIKLEASCVLETAYALYKLGKLDEATSLLVSVGIQKRSLSHLAAQVAYRSENFDEAQSIYHRLLASDIDEEANDLRINIQAAQAQAVWKDVSASYATNPENAPDAFELCYNAACANIARGSLQLALKLLQRALALCDASDELTDEDKDAERQPILAQQALVLAKMGDVDRARDMYSSINIFAETDFDFNIVTQNNRWALEKKPRNPFLVERDAASWMSARSKAKLFKFQSDILARNASVVDLRAFKVNGVKERAKKATTKAQMPSCNPDLNAMSVIGAAAETQGLAKKDSLRSLLTLSKNRPNDTGLVLTIVQLHLERKNLGAATHALTSFFSRLEESGDEQSQRVRFCPGLVALAVALKKTQKRKTSAKAELVKAAEFWRERPTTSVVSLLEEAGIELASSPNPDEMKLGGVALTKLHNENQTSPIISAGLVAALAASSAGTVEQHVAQLPSVESLVNGIDIDSLVNSGVASTVEASSASKKRQPPAAASSERPGQKRRRIRLPKNLVEGQTPDPERWLPLRDRSTYRPKGKKGRKKAADSTQGGVVKDEETLGLVGGGGVKVEKASASSSSKKMKKGKK